MAIEATYQLYVDWSNDGDFNDNREDCTAQLINAKIARGFSNPLARVAGVGRATFVMKNIDKQYSPLSYANVRPAREVKFEMTYDGSTVELFRGKLDSIQPTSGEYGARRAVFQCIDGMTDIDAVEAKIALALHVTADEIIEDVTDTIPSLPAPSYEVGINLFATSADRWVHQPSGGWTKENYFFYEQGSAAGKIMDAVTADWGRFYIAKDGIPTFINRHHMALDSSTELTLTTPIALGYRMQQGNIYNIVEVKCHPRTVGGQQEVLWEMAATQAPMVNPSDTLTMDCKFGDPDNKAITVGGANCTTPVANVDYTATSDEAGDGDDKTAQIGVVATFYGDRATLAITNNDANAVYLQSMRIRGYAVRAEAPWTALVEDATSKATYGGRCLSINAILLSQPYQAIRLAEYLLSVYKDPSHQISGVSFVGNASAALMAAARDLELCDRLSITEAQVGLSSYLGHIYKVQHDIAMDGVSHRVTMDIQTAFDPGTPFRLETSPPGGGSALNSGHVLIY